MGDRIYRRGVTSFSISSSDESEDLAATGTTGQHGNVPFPGYGNGLQAPFPPSVGGMMGLQIPSGVSSLDPSKGEQCLGPNGRPVGEYMAGKAGITNKKAPPPKTGEASETGPVVNLLTPSPRRGSFSLTSRS